MTPQRIESQAIAKVAEDYRRRGYTVSVTPPASELPNFLAGYQPDIIARSDTESVVVEVKVSTRTSVAERFREIAERINRQPGWRFSLVYVSPSEPDQLVEADPAPLPELEQRAREADSLLNANQVDAAFLLYWSTVEGSLGGVPIRVEIEKWRILPVGGSPTTNRPSAKTAAGGMRHGEAYQEGASKR